MELTTERLLLRPFQETDHEDLYARDQQGHPVWKDTYMYAILNTEYTGL